MSTPLEDILNSALDMKLQHPWDPPMRKGLQLLTLTNDDYRTEAWRVPTETVAAIRAYQMPEDLSVQQLRFLFLESERVLVGQGCLMMSQNHAEPATSSQWKSLAKMMQVNLHPHIVVNIDFGWAFAQFVKGE